MKKTLLLFSLFLSLTASVGAADRYWVGGTANWDGTAGAKWALTSGGASGEAVPTATDDCYFDAASGAVTVTVTATANCLSLTFTGFTGTFAGSSALNVAGSLTLATGMTRTYTGALTFTSTATGKTITLNGKTTASAIVFNGVGGGWTVQDDWSNGTSNITLTNGSLDTNGKTLTLGTFSSSNTNVRSLTLGTSTINLSNLWTFGTATNLTFSAGSSTINVAGTLFQGGALTYNTVTATPASTFTLTGLNTFSTLNVNGTATKAVVLSLAANQTITGTLSINGNSSVNRIIVRSSQAGQSRTLTGATISVTNADFQDIVGAGAGSWNIAAVSGLSGDCNGNSGITFTTATTTYWVGNTGNWSATTSWSYASGGSIGARPPLCQDDVVFDNNSFNGASQTATGDMAILGKSINWSAYNEGQSPTFTTNVSITIINGSLILPAGVNLTSTSQLSFQGRSSFSLTNGGNTWANVILEINSVIGSLTLQDTLSAGTGSTLILSSGTFSTNNNPISIGGFSGSGSIDRTLNLGSSLISLTGTNGWQASTASNFTFSAGTSVVKFTSTSGTAITFAAGGLTYNNVWLSRGSSVATTTISGSNTFNNFRDDGTGAHPILFTTGTTQTMSSFSVRGTSAARISIDSTTTGTHTLILNTGGRACSEYLDIQHSVATPSYRWFAGAYSVNDQGVATAGSGWQFKTCPGAWDLSGGRAVISGGKVIIKF